MADPSSPAKRPGPAPERASRRNVWKPVSGGLATMGDLVGAARAVAMTGERRSGSLRGTCSEVILERSIEGVCYTADPSGHAVEVTKDGVLLLARYRDAASRMVHFARNGYRRLIDRHYRLTHLMLPGSVWIRSGFPGPQAGPEVLMIIEAVRGGRVTLRHAATGGMRTARIERFDGRTKGYHPAPEDLAKLALQLLQRSTAPPPA